MEHCEIMREGSSFPVNILTVLILFSSPSCFSILRHFICADIEPEEIHLCGKLNG